MGKLPDGWQLWNFTRNITWSSFSFYANRLTFRKFSFPPSSPAYTTLTPEMATLNQTWLSQEQKCQRLSPKVTQAKAVLPGMPKCGSLTAAPGPQCLSLSLQERGLFEVSWCFVYKELTPLAAGFCCDPEATLLVHNLLHFVANQGHLIFLLKCFFTLIVLPPFLLPNPWLLWIKIGFYISV